MTTQARINVEGIPEHEHPGKSVWHSVYAGHYIDARMTVWDGTTDKSTGPRMPTIPPGPKAPRSMKDLYEKALTRQVVHHIDGHIEYNERPQREM